MSDTSTLNLIGKFSIGGGIAGCMEELLSVFDVDYLSPLPSRIPLSALAVGSAEKINQMVANQMAKFPFWYNHNTSRKLISGMIGGLIGFGTSAGITYLSPNKSSLKPQLRMLTVTCAIYTLGRVLLSYFLKGGAEEGIAKIKAFNPNQNIPLTLNWLDEEIASCLFTDLPNLPCLKLKIKNPEGFPALTTHAYESLKRLNSLKSLHVKWDSLRWYVNLVDDLAAFPMIEKLTIWTRKEISVNTKVEEQIISIRNKIMPNPFTDKSFPNLKEITLSNDISEHLFTVLRPLAGLQTLILEENRTLTKLPGQLNQVSELIVSNDRTLTDEGFKQIHQFCPNIKTLRLIDCPLLTQEAFRNIKELKKLEAIEISNCNNILDEFFDHLPPQTETLLKTLTLVTNNLISKEKFEEYKSWNTGITCTFS